MDPVLSHRELRVGRRLEARGETGLLHALLRLRGSVAGGQFRLEQLYAVGGEGAIYLARDLADPAASPRIAKLALLPWHRPARLTSEMLRRARGKLLSEARLLEECGSPFLPFPFGVHDLANPLSEGERGGEFARPEPCLVMERVQGPDLDVWLCRVHRGGLDRALVRRTLDRIVVAVVQGLTDLERRGYLYADLRPGNLRVTGRPQRRVRLLDAGACAREDDADARFPHVPAYLPPAAFAAHAAGAELRPTASTQAVMAGRTLYEVATGEAPRAGRPIDLLRLAEAPVSRAVGEAVAALSEGGIRTCGDALALLGRRALRRVPME